MAKYKIDPDLYNFSNDEDIICSKTSETIEPDQQVDKQKS